MNTAQTISQGEPMTTIDNVCDYIVVQCTEAGEPLQLLKLQKLAYYGQAWHLVYYGERLFDNEFQAWVHGPVCRELYDRFRKTKSLYSDVTESDIQPSFDLEALSLHARSHLDVVLEAYAKFSGSQLEALSHQEEPWVEARGNCPSAMRCENVISDETMQRYYSARS